MAPSAQAHKRSHSLLLLQKLLNLRDNASPLTLVLDTLEQGSAPVLQEFTTRAKISRTKVIFISFATIKKPANADILVRATGKPLQKLHAEITSHYPAQSPPAARNAPPASSSSQKTLLIIDTLNPLSTTHPRLLTPFLSSLITHPTISLVATYHADVPLALALGPAAPALSEYEPHPLTVLNHLATAVLRVSSLHQAAEAKRARDRSLPAPAWGLAEGREGVLVGFKGVGAGGGGGRAVVVEMELRRRSGRAVVETFVLEPARGGGGGGPTPAAAAAAAAGTLSLLSDHPLFAAPVGGADDGHDEDEDLAETTFNLGLTEKQRKDREGIVLPYFDAQKDVGGGEGGRILYEMGREDDFDDEEDEI
ncbi:hypothetical protein KVR01_011178 [Diaporthe batatas]|uniref:uncharacterized protein n=1 Tax=Diaporthe batatas TaxID=748121 RepID=UPI001D05BEBB|nr:uncharacterized protein KVR01_011178 [Diaporthe batatas]KAG8158735.1 hypothetical protein KVR01_011178 [Diaporthe batatas]